MFVACRQKQEESVSVKVRLCCLLAETEREKKAEEASESVWLLGREEEEEEDGIISEQSRTQIALGILSELSLAFFAFLGEVGLARFRELACRQQRYHLI